jgi:hypothetical protein
MIRSKLSRLIPVASPGYERARIAGQPRRQHQLAGIRRGISLRGTQTGHRLDNHVLHRP